MCESVSMKVSYVTKRVNDTMHIKKQNEILRKERTKKGEKSPSRLVLRTFLKCLNTHMTLLMHWKTCFIKLGVVRFIQQNPQATGLPVKKNKGYFFATRPFVLQFYDVNGRLLKKWGGSFHTWPHRFYVLGKIHNVL